MFPIPIISNTSKAEVNEIDKLYQEMVASGYPRITNYSSQPSSLGINIWMTGSVFNASNYSNVMYGSSYGSRFTQDSYFSSIFLHAFPNIATYNYYKANPNTPAYMRRTAIISYPSYPSVNRNGYTSISYSSFSGCTSDLFVYIDPVSLKAMQYNPNLMTTPTRYYQ